MPGGSGKVAVGHQCGAAGHNDAPVLQADKGDEQADADRGDDVGAGVPGGRDDDRGDDFRQRFVAAKGRRKFEAFLE